MVRRGPASGTLRAAEGDPTQPPACAASGTLRAAVKDLVLEERGEQRYPGPPGQVVIAASRLGQRCRLPRLAQAAHRRTRADVRKRLECRGDVRPGEAVVAVPALPGDHDPVPYGDRRVGGIARSWRRQTGYREFVRAAGSATVLHARLGCKLTPGVTRTWLSW